jgi:uncharacterized membrane protein YbhN (UPF0104 family)
LAGSWIRYERFTGTLGLAEASLEELVSGPPSETLATALATGDGAEVCEAVPITSLSRKSSISSDLASSAASSRRGIRWPGLLGLFLSVALLWWTLHDVALSEVWSQIRNVRLAPFLGMVVLATATFPLRTVRWRYILRLEGSTLPFVPLWHATAIGFMANNLLPARAGELARAYSARQLTAVRFSTAIATETTLGGMSLVGIVRSSGVLFLLLLLAAVALVHWPHPALHLARVVSQRILPPRWANRLLSTLEGLLSGLDALRSLRRFALTLVWTLVVWLVNAASFWLCLVAFDLGPPPAAALVVQGVIAFGVALPLALYGVPAARAVSYAVGYHFATFIPITLLGLWSLSRAHLHLADLRTVRMADGKA